MEKTGYIETLKERAKKSRVYRKYQLTGLLISQLLNDEKHKSLYIKLAKEKDQQKLLELARDVSDRKNVSNKGAYFMTLLTKVRKYTRATPKAASFAEVATEVESARRAKVRKNAKSKFKNFNKR
ncbi:hypothetical protein HYV91_03705 [Candidatus Wolfebacteria bacterium]|nr:hypothetical protein [Candidatus Wolfebacteria bacterium]